MSRSRFQLAVVAIIALAAAAPLEAQVARVFVSVNGNDLNVCSNVATPCRTFAGGITQVDAEGEVIVIDSGSYAGATITKPVKINVAEGVVAFSALPMTVDPGADKLVVLRGLTLKAATPAMGTGISLVSGQLSVERSVIDGWGNGLAILPGAQKALVADTTFRNNAVSLFATTASHTVVENSRVVNSDFGFQFPLGSTGVITKTQFSGTGTVGVLMSGATVAVSDCVISEKQFGLYLDGGGTLRLAGSVVTKNTTGVSNVSSVFATYGNNQLRGNGTDVLGAITPVTLQ
jgi:nitrous oxidase accessory protein NosD